MASSRPEKGKSPLLDEAIRLQSMGLSVLPIGAEKKSWKPFQTTAAGEVLIRDWFSKQSRSGCA